MTLYRQRAMYVSLRLYKSLLYGRLYGRLLYGRLYGRVLYGRLYVRLLTLRSAHQSWAL